MLYAPCKRPTLLRAKNLASIRASSDEPPVLHSDRPVRLDPARRQENVMDSTRRTAHSSRFFLFRTARYGIFCALIFVAAMLFLRHSPAEAAAAIYSHDTLTLTIPYDAD